MSKTTKTLLITLVLVVSLALSFWAGYALGTKTPPVQGLDTVEEAWNIIFHDYVDQDRLDANALSQGAIKGMVEAVDDPYTAYVDAGTYQLGVSNLEGKFEGIGAYIGVRDEQLMIIAPVTDSPADKAGIKAGDIILEIDGKSTAEMNVAEAVLSIRGPKGTPVKLRVLHQGTVEPEQMGIKQWEIMEEIEIVRAEIELPSVRFEMREDIAYINITYFSERTAEEFSSALQSITEEAATGIILDLRSNPGGLLETVVDVASHFLKEGVVVNVVDSQGKQAALSVKPNRVATDLPVIVLVDSFSASGSEVLVGALQDYARATVAGTRTHGKGSVNILRQLKDGSGIYITTARWLTPNGRLIEGEGLSPDHELELKGEDAVQWAIDYLKGNK
ncbi:MAG: S41 family peptidase [Dehalococcoidales bacterium]